MRDYKATLAGGNKDLNDSKVLLVFKLTELDSAVVLSGQYKHSNYHNKAADGEFFRSLFEKHFQENYAFKRSHCFERKKKSEMKSNFEHLFELPTL